MGKCLVYHFGSVTTRKKDKNLNTYLGSKANKIFIKKWGLGINFFEKFYLKGGLDRNKNFIFRKYDGPLKSPKKNLIFFLELFIIKIKFLYLKLIN